MEPASLIGLVLVLVGTFVGSTLKGVGIGAYFGVPAAFLIVVVASIGASMMSNAMADVKNMPKAFMKAFKPGDTGDPSASIDTIVQFAERARREGLLAGQRQLGAVGQGEDDRHRSRADVARRGDRADVDDVEGVERVGPTDRVGEGEPVQVVLGEHQSLGLFAERHVADVLHGHRSGLSRITMRVSALASCVPAGS